LLSCVALVKDLRELAPIMLPQYPKSTATIRFKTGLDIDLSFCFALYALNFFNPRHTGVETFVAKRFPKQSNNR
jgi:hypothetical protein